MPAVNIIFNPQLKWSYGVNFLFIFPPKKLFLRVCLAWYHRTCRLWFHQSEPKWLHLTWPLLILQHALCGHHLETGITNKLLRTKGPFCIKKQGGGVKDSQVHIRGRCVLPVILYYFSFYRAPTPVFPCPHSCHPLPSRSLYLHSSVVPSPPCTPPSSSMCWGQSQIYNNCQSQGWQIN